MLLLETILDLDHLLSPILNISWVYKPQLDS